MNAKSRYNLTTTPACVLADGPHETDGDGGFEFVVCFGDADGDPITENYDCIWKVRGSSMYDGACECGGLIEGCL